MSGLLLGILLSRVLSGAVAQVGGWRSVLLVAAGIQLVMSVSVYVLAPATGHAAIGERYPQVLASIIALIRVHPMLRHRMVLGFLGMACFSGVWTAIAFLLAGAHSSPYHYSEFTIGLFGLAGVAGALGAPVVGRLADRGYLREVTTWSGRSDRRRHRRASVRQLDRRERAPELSPFELGANLRKKGPQRPSRVMLAADLVRILTQSGMAVLAAESAWGRPPTVLQREHGPSSLRIARCGCDLAADVSDTCSRRPGHSQNRRARAGLLPGCAAAKTGPRQRHRQAWPREVRWCVRTAPRRGRSVTR
jgi:MFS family permease